jgi:hypothetical protein
MVFLRRFTNAALPLEIVSRPLPFWNPVPTFTSSLENDGDDRRPVEECQRGQWKPNEDAVAVPSGLSGRLREANDEY